jgi:D-alanine-D-alanine ligase
MRVGMTYDLRDDYLAQGYGEEETAELDQPQTIEAIADALRELGHEPVSVGNLPALMTRLLAGERWDLVFNIAEGLWGAGREAQVPALLDAWRIPYTFSDPMVLALTLHKGMTKHVVRDCGVRTPDFAVVETLEDLGELALPFPLFCKPVAEGTGKGVGPASRVQDRPGLERVCADLLRRFAQPVLVEAYLPGREFTVGITGTGRLAQAIGVLEVVLREQAEPGAYSFLNKEHYDVLVEYRLTRSTLAERVQDEALRAWRALGCRDGGRVDLRLDADGAPHFLEVNPLAGLNPVRSDLPILCRQAGISYLDLIRRIVDSALRRVSAA